MTDSDALVEAMAEPAHEAWMLAQRREGVTSRKAEWGEEFMVPFAALSERGREFDRVIMRAILAAFDGLGIAVLPHDLAQRILAALDEHADDECGFGSLASELRARMPPAAEKP